MCKNAARWCKNLRSFCAAAQEIVSGERVPTVIPAKVAASDFGSQWQPVSVQRPSYTSRTIHRALQDSAARGELLPGVLTYFGTGHSRKVKLRQLDSVQCSLMIYSLGILSKNKANWKEGCFLSFADDLVEEVTQPERLQSTDHLGLAQILYGFSFFPRVESFRLDAVVKYTVESKILRKLDGRTLTSLLTSLARSRYDNRDVINRLSAQALKLKKQLSDQELSNVFWSFGILNVGDTTLLEPLSAEMLHPRILSAFAPQGLANILTACARLRFRHRPFLDRFMEEVTLPYRRRSLEDRHLSNIIWAAGRLCCIDKEHLQLLAQECLAAERVQRFTEPDIRSIFTGWALVGECPHAETYHVLLHRVLHPTNGCIEQFADDSVAQLVWAIGKLAMTSEADFEAMLVAATRPRRLQHYNNHDLSNIFIGCAKQRFRKDPLIQPLLREAAELHRLSAYNDQQLANLTWALGEIEARDMRLYRVLARAITESRTFCQKPGQVVMTFGGWAHGQFSYLPGIRHLLEEILQPSKLSRFLPHDLRSILWCLRELNFVELYMIQRLEDQLPENNRGVLARYRQRSMSQDAKQWPELFTARRVK